MGVLIKRDRTSSSVFDRLGSNPKKIKYSAHHLTIKPPINRDDKGVICRYWLQGRCSYGQNCRFLHRPITTTGSCFTFVRQLLPSHDKGIAAIAAPFVGDHLYTAGKDGSVRVWDCPSGECVGVFDLGGGAEIGCMLCEGPWVLVGVSNSVRVWNSDTNTSANLSCGPVGKINALATRNHTLFAATEKGTISAWRYTNTNTTSNHFERLPSLEGHTSAVVSLVGGDDRLYSGSLDSTIRVWCLKTMQCRQVLTDHTSTVTSLLCWTDYLISCALDNTIRVWAATQEGKVEVIYTHHTSDHSVLSLSGVNDAQEKPLLLCSCDDNVVRVYELPSFKERGRIFSTGKEAIRTHVEVGDGGMFFTGDEAGHLSAWQLSK